ncbi:cytochrome c oxidase assembly protein [Palleronia pelagia]|uniref:Putative membrane protein n=1 Tax=Palleronia pelagia TaxID=387096 RepID=A0A1H8L254_9RHOB|nr:cytochrome c oxidase assembly protein [Palleronia pelagia]SEN98728.1 putative membrane protein [Palleronia pelagia]
MNVAAILSCALLLAIWGLPWSDWLGHFPAHMIRHMGLVAVVAPLIVLGFPRLADPLALSPLAGAVLEFLVVWGFHLPVLHEAAMASPVAFLIEQALFLIVGVVVWAGCVRTGGLAGAGGLLLTSMHMTLLGALLTLSPRVIYALDHAGALQEQQLGGMLMLAIGTPIYLIAGLWLVARSLEDTKDEMA